MNAVLQWKRLPIVQYVYHVDNVRVGMWAHREENLGMKRNLN